MYLLGCVRYVERGALALWDIGLGEFVFHRMEAVAQTGAYGAFGQRLPILSQYLYSWGQSSLCIATRSRKYALFSSIIRFWVG